MSDITCSTCGGPIRHHRTRYGYSGASHESASDCVAHVRADRDRLEALNYEYCSALDEVRVERNNANARAAAAEKERDELKSWLAGERLRGIRSALIVVSEGVGKGGYSASELAEQLGRPISELHSARLQDVASITYEAGTELPHLRQDLNDARDGWERAVEELRRVKASGWDSPDSDEEREALEGLERILIEHGIQAPRFRIMALLRASATRDELTRLRAIEGAANEALEYLQMRLDRAMERGDDCLLLSIVYEKLRDALRKLEGT